MKTSVSDSALRDLTAKLADANNKFATDYPGETGRRQPVHTVYGGAHLFKSDTAVRLGALARRSLDQFAPDFIAFAQAIGLAGAEHLPQSIEEGDGLRLDLENNSEGVKRKNKAAWLANTIYNRVNEK